MESEFGEPGADPSGGSDSDDAPWEHTDELSAGDPDADGDAGDEAPPPDGDSGVFTVGGVVRGVHGRRRR
jgi:hypothetical protein